MWIARTGIIAGSGGFMDADALAFITAATITDATQQSAINTLVTDLKSANIWTKMRAIYPFIGGTATTHKFNLKDPRDLDAAFRLVFSGGWTHGSTGALPNGTTAYANTFLNENTTLLTNDSHISTYLRTNVAGTYADMGVVVGSYETNIYAKITTTFYPRIQANNGGINIGSVSSAAFYLSNRVNSTQVFGYRNATKYIVTSTSLGKCNDVFYLGAVKRNGTPQNYSPREQAFATIGDGLTDAEATAFYNAVQIYQTTLGRQV